MSLISANGELPRGFVLAKPIGQEKYDESDVYSLEERGELIITRKRDGWKIFAVVGHDKKVRLFTDGLNEIDERLIHIRLELGSLGLPKGLVLVGEAIIDRSGADDIGKVISLFHSSVEKAIQFQKANGRAKFMVFGAILPGHKENQIAHLGLLKIISTLLKCDSNYPSLRYVFIAQGLDTRFDSAKKLVVEQGWEGLVLYDTAYVLTYRLDGKEPKRPDGCYKWKPILEDDFIVREVILRPNGKAAKELVLSQIEPGTNVEFECGKLSSFTEEMRRELISTGVPFVVQARFDMRFPKSGKIRNARFMRIREDKKVRECVAPTNFPNHKSNGF